MNLILILKLIKVINHFENIRGICTKTGLVRSLKKYYNTNEQARKLFTNTLQYLNYFV